MLTNFRTIDMRPSIGDFLSDVIKGLSDQPKQLAPKYCYDEIGSQYFEQITRTDEYYVTRIETQILENLRPLDLSDAKNIAVIDLGGASAQKFRLLMPAVPNLKRYIPIDISKEELFRASEVFASEFPELQVTAICADYQMLQNLDWPGILGDATPLVFFPGSTLGNMSPDDALSILTACRAIAGTGGYLLLGCDLLKDPSVMRAAYSDREGANARFNLNVLHRINRELEGNFVPELFAHDVRFEPSRNQIEIKLVSQADQTVSIAGKTFHFAEGESIHAECSRKFSLPIVEEMARHTGFALRAWITDPQGYFALAMLQGIADA